MTDLLRGMLFSLKSSNTVISGCHLKAGILAAYRKLVLDCRVADPKLVEPESHGYDPTTSFCFLVLKKSESVQFVGVHKTNKCD